MIAPHYADGPVTLYAGDCIEVMRDLPTASVDAVVTDPPYGLEFMGRDWDGADGFRRSLNAADVGRESTFGRMSAKAPEYRAGKLFQDWCELWATEALRVLKPGGHLLAFGGTRTFHRLTAGIEDAGFEIRDSIAWLYGSGFPKSLDVSKAIDKAAGAAREVVGSKLGQPGYHLNGKGTVGPAYSAALQQVTTEQRAAAAEVTAPATDAAGEWAGWGTALKPAFEPIVVARKPLAGTVAANVLAHGTGALNIDASRIHPTDPAAYAAKGASVVGLGSNRNGAAYGEWKGERADSTSQLGRWPANVILDESQAAALDQQSGDRPSRGGAAFETGGYGGSVGLNRTDRRELGYGDTGGASRFFYTAKAPGHERPEVDGTSHPTVKPLDLMQWLVRLVTPKGGTVLEPFAGSGTTVEACLREGFDCIAIERETDYLPLILKRVRKDHAVGFDFGDWDGEAV